MSKERFTDHHSNISPRPNESIVRFGLSTHLECGTFAAAKAWLRYFVFQTPTYNIVAMTYKNCQQNVLLSIEESGLSLELTSHLSWFQAARGMLLTWHNLD